MSARALTVNTSPRLPAMHVALSPAALARAFARVRANRGGAGGDGVTIEAFAANLDAKLVRLAAELAAGSWRPGPLRHASIAKPSGGVRVLAIPCIADRVAQTAMLAALVPVLDARMSAASFAYRPGRSVTQALALARTYLAQGRTWVLDADIRDFFGSVPHARLLEELAIWIDDDRLYALAGVWLRACGSGRGLPQGAPLSPLFANLYLHPLDRILIAGGIRAVRYADDFLCLCENERAAWRTLRIVRRVLACRGLALAREKTRIVNDPAHVVFLGERLAVPSPASRQITTPPHLSRVRWTARSNRLLGNADVRIRD